jgi:lactoylglutathione lyase
VTPAAIEWHEGPRAALRHLFALADDSSQQIDGYIDLGRVLVALDDAGAVIGHAQLVPTRLPGVHELKSIAVLPDHRHRGVGRALVERVVAVCRSEGARALTVTTATADTDNVLFYQRCGFRATAIGHDAFTPATGYPPGLEANGIPVRDSITFTLAFEGIETGTSTKSLFETHLTVRDLDRSIAFYRDVVGLPLALHDREIGAAFFWVDDVGEAMLGLWAAGTAPMGIRLHVAFKIPLEDVLHAGERLRSLGVTPLSFDATETDEPSVIGWMPAAAIYFRDPDGHLLEYLAMLDERPDPASRIMTWSEWSARPRPDAWIRDALPDDAVALEALQRRSSDVWEEYRAQLAAHPDAIEPPHRAIAEGRVRVAVDASQRRLGFSVVLPVENGRCELDDLFVEPDSMGLGIGRLLVDDVARRAAAAGAHEIDVIANPNALGFYERVGFRVTGDASTRFGPGIRMSLDLAE